MGYYTYYALSVEPSPVSNQTKLSEELQKRLNAEVDKMQVFDYGDAEGGWSGEAKWYDHNEDMISLSHRFPEVLFTLYGNGEDSEDMWYAYFLDGSIQEAPVQFDHDEFDMFKLRDIGDPSLFSPDRKYSYEY